MANVWRRNKSDEDGFTASFFEKIAKNPDTTLVHGHLWEWSIDYSTTSSRGQKPLETVIGADVIFFIEIKLPNKKVYRKGIVIQSKITSKMNSRSWKLK